MLGPAATPLDLRFTLPSGQEAQSAQLLLVSNNPYQLARLRGGMLGIAYVRVDTAADADRLADLELIGQVQRFARWSEWTSAEFEVRSAVPLEVGVDGEALTLEPPLRFVIRPRALTVRLPRTAPGRSPAARAVRVIAKPTVVALWQTVLGRPTVTR
jgi:diacylglycerol kinase family enzyme